MARIVDYDRPPDIPRSELPALVGGKAAGLTVMALDLGLPVPPAFTLTTAICRDYLATGWPDGLDDEIRAHLSALEAKVGRRYGDAADPLLVSVRSGAPVSMPGMMDTLLNVGSGPDPWAELRAAIESVFRSWHSPRAITYREKEGIADDLGTAATVQAMVFGNRNDRSATGVLFTRNPATGAKELYGDVLLNAQGEEVVSGTRATEPIGVLGDRLPKVAAELATYSDKIERHLRDAADIEFTIEDGRLWMLQCRVGKRSPLAALRMAVEMAEEPHFPLSREEAVARVAAILADPPRVADRPRDAGEPLTTGLGASPGVATGEVVTSPDAAVEVADAGRSVILVRRETSPDDVHGMARAAGILTSTGGLACHAAVVARGWGVPAVVGAAALTVESDGFRIDGRLFAAGEVIAIDGTTGEVFLGALEGGLDVPAEVAILRAWSAESTGSTNEAAPQPAADGQPASADLTRLLLVKGYVTPEAAAEILATTAETALVILDRLVEAGTAEQAAGAFRLTAAGKEEARAALDRERQEWGDANAATALDSFIGYDRRVKETVTAWQMRDANGEQQVNDHSDAAYDASVLDGLNVVHREVGEWLDAQSESVSRFGDYRRRLDLAMSAVNAGDHRYVASPRVDSYHSAWFELHEELILLAGSSRAEEVAAGRA